MATRRLLNERQTTEQDDGEVSGGISAMADTPEHASDYLRPLLSFAAAHVPVKKHKETPLYILCTAGMRLLPESRAQTDQEEAAKVLLAEFNLGCDVQHTEHVYRVYVTTFLGFGGNFARQRYEDLVLNETLNKNRLLGQKTGLSPDNPFLDPCLPVGLTDVVERNGQVLHVRGKGQWATCGAMLSPLLARSNTSQASLNGIYQSPIDFNNSEFYGFSEFFYCTEDVLRIGGRYHGPTFAKAAQDYCGMSWSVLSQRFKNGLFSSHADEHRLKYQCFKSAWMYQVLHEGFHFPYDYPNLRTAQLVYDREVQWTLGAILYKTRFLPLRDLRQEGVRQAHSSWLRLSFVYNHYLFFACILVVLLAIILYLLRLRRIHHRQTRASAPLDLLWIEEVVPMIGVQTILFSERSCNLVCEEQNDQRLVLTKGTKERPVEACSYFT
ncbi:Ectonucleoside triphosphate diphosphohydrolase 7 [Tupaia chinensis]|uniref:Ectonucleoside triphosphate diphosphohydrolase 7 n=1 Tax=Tupaia chinensis TaxID=246437 RepID=L9JG44_TUPCH|nr:Ectonucleoside triphosphate diphosphohydrolase 7 [Tupaia chinensis]